ncbi:HIT family protein [Iodobacter fluviatilis]|uniref:Diadenosine tetraphosphate (Ap4A) HIT family hydrolase n=1 Tax=Iodobacter fluviatilis TaxID=537 RepID=A0A377SXE9_9NEIS|nr:HIT family protein [Iodobacter fluviatilis]TCU88172.1 diadenosine tetraphosphate (Ap4A) HIT family hydrolase [Iodobacter fluviatilis]STR45673.1 HIT domain [Iodobacter fluviatilis]
MNSDCVLCSDSGGEILWQDDFCRVVLADEAGYPGFCRVILKQHTAEFSDLNAEDRQRLMQLVFVVESAIRSTLQPDKVNLASLGNMVPHLHWHVIPRFKEDRHFPAPIWAEAVKPDAETKVSAKQLLALRIALQAIQR